jgi:hypothetical protein
LNNSKASQPKLAIVIHTEEEFDWHGGFYRSNNDVTHGEKLTVFCEKLISIGAKITFALDYAFITSEQGKKVVKHFKKYHLSNVEFATHLHPWVSPPFAEKDQIDNHDSYPGNLKNEIEFEKLKLLTDKIFEISGVLPTSYLAGRYGVGENTTKSLKSLGYSTDISISPFSDFTHQEGPNFSDFNNKIFEQGGIIHWPHTTAIVSLFPFIEKWFDQYPKNFEKLQGQPFNRLLLKLLRVKRQRLSPEGFGLNDLKKITKTQLRLGHCNLVFSFHSPSVQAGLTPYVTTEQQATDFYNKTAEYIQWFQTKQHGKITTVQNAYTNKKG